MAKTPGNSPDWRGGGPDPARRPKQDWQKHGQDPQVRRPVRTRRFKAVVVTAVFFSLLGGTIALIKLLEPQRETHVLLVHANYTNNLAVPHGEIFAGSADRIQNAVAAASPKRYIFTQKINRAEKAELVRELRWDAQLQKVATDAPSVIVYIAAHGGSDENGMPFILPSDAEIYPTVDSPPNANVDKSGALSGRMYLDSLFKALSAPELSKKHKLLVFDCSSMTANLALGMVQNDFVIAVQNMLKKQPVKGLAVLCSCGPNQRSWESNEHNATYFALAFSHGISGIDKLSQDKDEYRVTVRSLANYVKKQVESRVWSDRGAYQSPLLLNADDATAKNEIAPIGTEKYDPPLKSEGKGNRFDGDLAQEWKRLARLRGQTPSPAAYHPEVWREYVDSLMRAEALLRVDSDSAKSTAVNFLKQASDCVKTLTDDMSFGSSGTSIAFQQWVAPTPDKSAVRNALDKLWNDPAAQVKAPPLELYGEALARLGNETDMNVFGAALVGKYLPVADSIGRSESGIRPSEAHLAYMLGKDLPEKLAPEHLKLVQRALSIRAQGERAIFGSAPKSPRGVYPERVLPAIAKKVREGDVARRYGEDHLFATDAASLNAADEYLKVAQAHYDRAESDGAKLRAAFATRDQAAWELPFWCRWAAHKRDEKAFEQFEPLKVAWQKLHQLDALLGRLELQDSLGKTPMAEPFSESELATIDRLATELQRDALQSLQADLDKKINEATAGRMKGVATETAEPFLALPFIDPDSRISLLKYLSEVYYERIKAPNTIEPAADAVEKEAAICARQAYAIGTFGLAQIGDSLFADKRLRLAAVANQTDNPSLLRDDLDKINAVATATPASRIDRAEKALDNRLSLGLQLGYRTRAVPIKTKASLEEARKLASERKSALDGTVFASRLGRIVDGGGVKILQASKGEEAIRPAVAARDLQLANLLYWLAGRTVDDHWYGMKKSGSASADPAEREPYFVDAAKLLRDDAKARAGSWLGPKRPAFFDDDFVRLQARLDGNGRIVLPPIQAGAANNISITTQKSVGFDYRIDLGPAWVGGYPVVSVASKDADLLKINPALAGSKPFDLRDAKSNKAPHAVTVTSPYLQEKEAKPPEGPGSKPAVVGVDAIFRGQRPKTEVGFTLHPLAESIQVRDRQPAAQSLYVYADNDLHEKYGPGTGTIVFVIDCSGSMYEYADGRDGPKGGAAKGVVPKEEQRFTKVQNAMNEILKQLPLGTRISVWAYAHKTSVWGDGKFPKTDGTNEQPEDQIEPLQKEPFRWAGVESPQAVDLIKKINGLEPEGWTPVARAMMEATRDFKYPGSKTMIVLTDGMDTTFEGDKVKGSDGEDIPIHAGGRKGDPKYNPDGKKGVIKDSLIKGFQGSGIRPYILGFQVVGIEKENMDKVFGPALEAIRGDKDGLLNIKDYRALLETLLPLLKQQMRYKLTRNNEPVPQFVRTLKAGDVAKDVAVQGTAAEWIPNLETREYFLSLETNRKEVEGKSVKLNTADNLLVKVVLNASRNGLAFERDILSNSAPLVAQERRQVDDGNYRIAALAKFEAPNGSQQALVAIEAEPKPTETELKMIRPQQAWMEGPGADATGQKRGFIWRTVYDWPAPAWQLEYPNGGKQSAFQIWWDTKNNAFDRNVEVILKRSTDRSQGGFMEAAELVGGRGKNVGKSEIVFEEITVEDRFVRVRPGAAPEARPCLIVRISHGLNDPVWLHRMEADQRFEGEEHRFFREANSVTSFYWPATPDAPKKIKTMHLLSVSGFKESFERTKVDLKIPSDAQTKDLPARWRVPQESSPGK